ncbi:MAG: TIGR02266 family protein [Sandaracinaceae bacterium]|nr:TIGR02266 family protein [Sandaracinaceae bacterium]
MTSPATSELKRGGLEAARDARQKIAALMSAVATEEPELGKRLSGVVAALFSAEVGDLQKIHDCLSRANEGLREILDEPKWAAREDVAKGVSRALALVHPARSALARELGDDPRFEDSTEPFLLTSSRVKPSSPPDAHERREALRAELEVEVGLEGANRFYSGVTGDLSAGGLFVATDTPLMVGTELVLSFLLPDGYRIATDAVVAWVRAPRYRPDELPAGMGVRFERLSDTDRNALSHFLKDRPPFRYGD